MSKLSLTGLPTRASKSSPSVDEGVDTGPIIAQFPIAIEPDEDEASLHERIKTIERRELVRFLRFLEHSTIEVSGRHVS
ncbi:formyltransferase family protein, partial [Brevibacterium paucivorans]|uniref:formyltransferase family protein n=1 Tax=Brevibacterium paucivorans TaxID=170994 RepID=UPI0027E4B52C